MFQTGRLEPGDHTGLKIRQLMSGPLLAASDANAMMAQAQVKFMLDYCFIYEDEKYKPIMVDLVLSKTFLEKSLVSGEPFIEEEISFSVPLITIVPLNSLAIDTLELGYDIHVLSHSVEPLLGENPELREGEQVVMYGNITNVVQGGNGEDPDNQLASSYAHRIKVKMKTFNIPLPTGVKTIIQAYSESIGPIDESLNSETP